MSEKLTLPGSQASHPSALLFSRSYRSWARTLSCSTSCHTPRSDDGTTGRCHAFTPLFCQPFSMSWVGNCQSRTKLPITSKDVEENCCDGYSLCWSHLLAENFISLWRECIAGAGVSCTWEIPPDTHLEDLSLRVLITCGFSKTHKGSFYVSVSRDHDLTGSQVVGIIL